MIHLGKMTLAFLAFGLLSVSAAYGQDPTIQIQCDLPGFGVQFSYSGTLSESDPNERLEKYVMKGVIQFRDSHRPNLEFKTFSTSGAFDVSRGVMRFSLRPNIHFAFDTFESIYFTQFTSGHQVLEIASGDLNGPNGGTNGQLCTIKKGSEIPSLSRE